MDLVVKALEKLPEGQETGLEIQEVLKNGAEFSGLLHRYRSGGQRKTERWKQAVRICLEEENDMFEVSGRNEMGKEGMEIEERAA